MKFCSRKVAILSTVIFFAIQYRVIVWALTSSKFQDQAVSGLEEATPLETKNNLKDAVKQHENLPTLYQYYTEGGIKSGLVPTVDGFLLNAKPFRIISGAVHYFRVHPAYWRDRLRKLRAAGLTVLETYVAWNLHEPQKDKFDFGKGENDMSLFLDLVSYLKIAFEEDLLVILRPGPYICSEWEFGGLPSWLLRDHTMQVRTSYSPYVERVDAFFEKLIPLVKNLQFTSSELHPNPIIAVQVENEYGAFGYLDHPRDKVYLQHLVDKLKELGIKELLFTSDSPARTADWGAFPGVLHTANFQKNVARELNALKQLQPNMPLMVTEFWSGWFDHWTRNHSRLKLEDFESSLMEILAFNASVSFYMFHGGTNFGFMNGAYSRSDFPGGYLPDTTSYDYDAPLSEAGDYTNKYKSIQLLIPAALAVQTRLPKPPYNKPKRAYASVAVESYLSFSDLVEQVDESLLTTSEHPISMENLPINDLNGQSYGFVVYRHQVKLNASSQIKIRGHVRDFAQVLVDGQLQISPIKSSEDLQNFGSWCSRDAVFQFGSWNPLIKVNVKSTLDIVVENMGRVNYGEPHDFVQKKGLWEGPIILDGYRLSDWLIVPLEFKGKWLKELKNWKQFNDTGFSRVGPLLVRATFNVTPPIGDTFIDMTSWGKGVVFVNGFNLGRYWTAIGPQQALYLPAPFLQLGKNTIMIYEQYFAPKKIKFSKKAMLNKKT